MAAPKKYPEELRQRAVRLYRESNPKPVIRCLAEQLGVHHEALHNWIRQGSGRAWGWLVSENRAGAKVDLWPGQSIR
ncbi:transposase [Micromonospora sp. CPCC 206171]|uniref:transposase n=1 Tax=Micromonospora sp. CPCC 206171 TaxID=3122405 RepID=UPI002FEF70F2